MSICMTDPFSFREHGVVIRHGVNVVAGFVGVWTRQRWRRRPRGRVMPGAEMAKYLLDDAGIIDDREDAHWALTNGAADQQARGWRPEAGDLDYLRRERSRPFRTLQVSRDSAPSSRCEGSARKPSRSASPTWYSTSRAEP